MPCCGHPPAFSRWFLGREGAAWTPPPKSTELVGPPPNIDYFRSGAGGILGRFGAGGRSTQKRLAPRCPYEVVSRLQVGL